MLLKIFNVAYLTMILVCDVVQIMRNAARPVKSSLAKVAFVDAVGIIQQREHAMNTSSTTKRIGAAISTTTFLTFRNC